jgi:hypothetical protein
MATDLDADDEEIPSWAVPYPPTPSPGGELVHQVPPLSADRKGRLTRRRRAADAVPTGSSTRTPRLNWLTGFVDAALEVWEHHPGGRYHGLQVVGRCQEDSVYPSNGSCSACPAAPGGTDPQNKKRYSASVRPLALCVAAWCIEDRRALWPQVSTVRLIPPNTRQGCSPQSSSISPTTRRRIRLRAVIAGRPGCWGQG